ncbi:MAG: hypothetical protein LBE34_12665 [Flavobacteriaceae bacterium]|jgi:hypothetical protein|nr:hypothetical protein [Flavobacteriaceae bacterium]
MYLIDLVYRTVLTIANSDVRGNIKPSEIRLLINTSIEEIYESYFYELNRMLNRQNKGLIGKGIENIPDLIRDKINYYLKNATVSISDGRGALPADIRYVESAFYNDTEVEILKSNKEFQLVKNVSNKSYPVCFKNDSVITVSPKAIDSIEVSYLRKVKVPNWTYVNVRGTEVFNPSAADFQDLDMHSSEISNIVIRTLQKVGINLKEQDLQQIMQQQQNIEFNQEIQS